MKKILVVDDEAPIRKLLNHFLSSSGYQVLEATEGGKGMKALKDNEVDLIITDLIMPGKEGLETIREIRKSYPDLPIIAMSGGGAYHDPNTFIKIAKAFGANKGFQKPFGKDDLLKAVKELLEE